jgi:DNA-binding response OmpR family regulator
MTQQHRKKVLIVEDDQDIHMGLSIQLGQEFETLQAGDALTAMRLIRLERPDAILLDLGLPGGGGLKVLEWLRRIPELAFTPTLVLTGHDGPGVEQQALEAGASGFFRKPASTMELLDQIRRLTAELPTKSRHRVLVVEDDEDVLEGLGVRLHAHGFEVLFAQDGVTAVAEARKNSPDVVVLDLGLPAGNGFTVLQRLKANESLASIPVIVLSGRDRRANYQRALDAGATTYLEKPAQEHELLAAIGAAL